MKVLVVDDVSRMTLVKSEIMPVHAEEKLKFLGAQGGLQSLKEWHD